MPEHTGRLMGHGLPVINREMAHRFGCVAAYCPGAFPNVPVPNLVSPGSGDLTTQGGGAHLKMTSEGPGLALTGTATNLFLRGIAPPQMKQGGKLSIFVRAQYTGNSSSNVPAPTFGVTYSTTGATGPYYSYFLSTSDVTHGNCMSAGLTSGSNGFLYGTFTPATLTANQMVSAGATFPMTPSGSTNWYLFQNGVKYASSTTSTGINYGATPWVVMGDPSGRARNVATTSDRRVYVQPGADRRRDAISRRQPVLPAAMARRSAAGIGETQRRRYRGQGGFRVTDRGSGRTALRSTSVD